MPELPEVHTTATTLDTLISGLTITSVWTSYKSAYKAHKESIKDPSYFLKFKRKAVGASITSVSRRAKNILMHLSNGYTILIHMKMTGHLLYGTYEFNKKKNEWFAAEEGPLQDPFNQWIRLVFSLSNGKHLAFSDLRKFAKVVILDSEALHNSSHLEDIGPEPLEESFTLPRFKERLATKSIGKIKTVLMDQTVLAGVGNIYSDETLWLSGIHPESRAGKIPADKIALMFKSMKMVLSRGIDFGGDSTSDYRNPHGVPGEFQYHHQAYRRTKSPCSKRGCNGTIQRKVIGGRSGHFCDTHQTLYI